MDVVSRNAGGVVSAVVEYDYTAKEPDELDLVKGAIIHNVKQMTGGWWEGTLQSNGKTGMFPDNFVRVIGTNEDNAVTLRDKSATSNRRCKVIYSYTQVNEDELSLAVGDVIEFLGEVEEGWWRGRLKTKVGVFPSNFVVAIEPSPILASKRPPSSAPHVVNAGGGTAKTAASANSATASAAAAAAAVAGAAAKKMNRLSFHSSKEDLLSSSSSTTTNKAATAPPPLDDVAPSLPPKPQREYCRVEFPYAPQNDDELELKVGDIIAIISMELDDKGWWKGEIRGKVGLFPDNFVRKLASSEVAPLNDTQQPPPQQQQQHSHRTAKTTNATNTLATSAASASATTSTTNITAAATSTTTITNSSAATSKVFIKKSGSTSSTQSSNRKDSFGSRDSLNDILSETGLPSGNVAAQRKSLENKNLDLTNAPDASTRLGLKKQQLQQPPQQPVQLHETKTLLSGNEHTTASTTTTTIMSSSSSTSNELRKSLENVDDKSKTTPPPVLTKKPTVPSKKSTSVTSVAGNILSGIIKQKVKSVDHKLTTAASHDYADGLSSSKMSPSGGLPDAAPSGHVVMRRAATIAVEDSDFDRVERASILTDMRAGRVKAPKRRPPSAAINVIGESNNNNSVYLNGAAGAGGGSAELLLTHDENKTQSSDDNSTGGEGERLAKPKPREWEKKKAPWMDELKASQVKKKTSPVVEPRTLTSTTTDRLSKLDAEERISSSSTTTTTTSSSSSTTKVQTASVSSSSLMQQSITADSSRPSAATDFLMAKSLSGKLAIDGASTATATSIDDVRARPNSLSIRNRSTSPLQGGGSGNSAQRSASRTSAATTTTTQSVAASSTSQNSTLNSNSHASSFNSTAAKTTAIVNNHNAHSTTGASAAVAATTTSSASSNSFKSTVHENNIPAVGVKSAPDAPRVIELERRVEKLEAVVHSQQRTIDELVRTLREETDRVKLLRGELDKYAQCVTQV